MNSAAVLRISAAAMAGRWLQKVLAIDGRHAVQPRRASPPDLPDAMKLQGSPSQRLDGESRNSDASPTACQR